MTQDLSQMRHALIALMDGRIDLARRLNAKQWQDMATVARDNRLQPLLHTYAYVFGAVVPTDVVTEWASAARRSAIRSLKLQKTLLDVDTILSEKGIKYAGLKGAWLVWNGYDNPASRPMRDIDILVEPGKVMEAFNALLQSGYCRYNEAEDPDFAVLHYKTMPALLDAKTGIAVELHNRITHGQSLQHPDKAFDNPVRLLAESSPLKVSGRAIAFPDPADSLLHLIIHTAIDHRFNNGALILSDIEAALRHPINWPKFWTMAKAEGWEKHCQLLLALAKRERSNLQSIEFSFPAVPNDVLDAAAELLLSVGPSERKTHYLALDGIDADGARPSGQGKWMALVRRTVPSRDALAAFAGLPGTSGLLWLHYPRWALNGLLRLLSSRQPQVRAAVSRHKLVTNWTSCSPSD